MQIDLTFKKEKSLFHNALHTRSVKSQFHHVSHTSFQQVMNLRIRITPMNKCKTSKFQISLPALETPLHLSLRNMSVWIAFQALQEYMPKLQTRKHIQRRKQQPQVLASPHTDNHRLLTQRKPQKMKYLMTQKLSPRDRIDFFQLKIQSSLSKVVTNGTSIFGQYRQVATLSKLFYILYRISATGTSTSGHIREVAALNSAPSSNDLEYSL